MHKECAEHRLPGSPAGFSLIELAIGMAVLGLVMGGALLVASKLWEQDRREETRAHMREVKQALLAYARLNGALPKADWTTSALGNTGYQNLFNIKKASDVDGWSDPYTTAQVPLPPPLTQTKLARPNNQSSLWLPSKNLQVSGVDAYGWPLQYNAHWQLTYDRQRSCITLNYYYKNGPWSTYPFYHLWGYPGYGWFPVIKSSEYGPTSIPFAAAAVVVSGGERNLDAAYNARFENAGANPYFNYQDSYYPIYYSASRDDIFEYITLQELDEALGCSEYVKAEY